MKKATRSEKQGSQSHAESITRPNHMLAHAPTKIARVLVYLRHFDTLNRFEAARLVGDTCLNSTIPVLEKSYSLTFEHIPEKSPNNWGLPCDCTRYRLLDSAYDKADKVLALMFTRGTKTPEAAA